jgi:hypothetical protein
MGGGPGMLAEGDQFRGRVVIAKSPVGLFCTGQAADSLSVFLKGCIGHDALTRCVVASPDPPFGIIRRVGGAYASDWPSHTSCG